MQRIGIDARLTYYRTGGISTYIRRLIGALEKVDTENHYTVFHSRKAHESLVKNFDRASLWTPCHHRLERVALSVELMRFRLDILHSPDFIPPLRGARKHIITVHDLNFLHYPQFLTAESHRYYNGQIALAVKHANHILADSTATRNDLMKMLNVPTEKITVHMLGVDEQFKPLPAETLARYRQQLELPDTYILFLGTFEPRKNIVGLLEAYQLLLNRMPDAPKLVLAGNHGWLFDETVARIGQMNMATVLALPSFYEGFGFPALEAMACGTVPIVSNRSSLPEVVGEVGLQIDPDDPSALAEALYYTLTNPEWRKTMRSAGLARAATFTWERTAKIVQSVYRSVI
jgi:glycosyltransferase involved in cell wall biosynthesis